MFKYLKLIATLIICLACSPSKESIEVTADSPISEETIETEIYTPTSEDIEEENRQAAENVAQRDGREDYQAYLQKLRLLGQRCYELDPKAYNYVEAMPSTISGDVLMSRKMINDLGVSITSWEVIDLYNEALDTETYRQYAPPCFNAALILIRDRYEN